MKPKTNQGQETDPLEKLRAIYQDFSGIGVNRGRITEADTRANILDRLIHDVLEWPREAVSREKYSKAGFLDYEFSKGIPILVVEAKAEGESFVIPHRKQAGPQRFKIGGALSSDKTVREALEQVQSYCNECGIRYAVATNGYSFIVFRAITEGSSWREGEAIVFPSPKIIESNFTAFWNLLSYEAVKDGKLEDSFRQVVAEARHFHRPIQSVVDADATYARNPLNIALRPYVDRFFGDIAKQSTIDVLRNCYVHSKPVQIIDEDLNLVIRDFIPRFAASQTTQIRTTTDSEGGNFETELREKIGVKRGLGSVVLLIGGIGSGKTTFLHRFFSVVAPDLSLVDGPVFRLHVDFLGAPDRISDLDEFLWKTVAGVLREQNPDLNQRETLEEVFGAQLRIIRGIFQNDEQSLARKITEEIYKQASDSKSFALAALRYCCHGKRLPVVVFDNVDQLGNELQTHIFTTAEYFANHLGCLAILVLREETYATAQMQKQLTAYTIKPYHLSSPSFRIMIRLRIDYATNDASTRFRTIQASLSPTSQYGQQDILDFFHLLRISVFNKNHNIMRLLEAVSFGNMRFALDMFNSFITSGATNMPKILEKFRDGGYNVPFHEFAKSVILGDYRFYKESRSPILNVFHRSPSRNSSHFTTLRILSFLEKKSESHAQGDGFVDLNGLVTAFVDVFDNEDDCLKAIDRLIVLRKQLVEVDTRRTDTLAGAFAIRITSAGKYYLDYLVNAFAYLDIMWQDTPFTDRGVCDQLTKSMHSIDVEERFERVERFLDYLGRQESAEVSKLSRDSNDDSVFGPFLPRIRTMFAKEKVDIRKRLLKARHRAPTVLRR